MNRTRRWAILALGGTLLSAAAVATSMVSCAATPTNTPLRSFESAKDLDVVCMQVFTTAENGQGAGIAITPPIPVDQQKCAPVPINEVGADLPYHLYALVTQTAIGAVAVVDLTGGFIVDEDPGTPGVNFLPVGANPTGIAAAPDGLMTFVASADPTKPAIYGLASVRILGAGVTYDGGIATVLTGGAAQIPTLPSWPACSLPAAPGPIVAVPIGVPGPSRVADAPAQTPAPSYLLAVVIPGDGVTQVARVLTIDPAPLLRGGGIDVGPGPVVAPGSLDHCPILGETPLSGQFQAPDASGPPWDDGVRYVDPTCPPLELKNGAVGSATAEAGCESPLPLPLPSFVCGDDAAVATMNDAGTSPPALPLGLPQAAGVARAQDFLYVADAQLPLIHVIDLSNPTRPTEIAPLVVTSAAQPSRPLSISGLAVSPPTSVFDAKTGNYRRYLYAIDQNDNPASIVVYDITDPVRSPHIPLTRPHPELSPQLPVDRIAFLAPVAAVAFAQHDFPVTENPSNGQEIVGSAGSGLICNPNTNVNLATGLPVDSGIEDASFLDPGAFYRNNFEIQQVALGPTRLRGIFGLATLTNGDVMLIDVDDWDSPCRRPNLMNGFTSDIAPPEITTPPGQSPTVSDPTVLPLDPYQVPEAGAANGVSYVTDEFFFPVSQPNRPRSQFPLDNDPTLGPHFPELQVQPQLFNLVTGSGLTAGLDAGNPNLLPTETTLADPAEAGTSTTGVRLAWEDPLVHLNQTWKVTYEGVIPTFGGLQVNIDLNTDDTSGKDHYNTLQIDMNNGLFCRRGVEDLSVGQQRIAAAKKAGEDAGVTFPPDMEKWVGDYVQIADELLPPTDEYWALPDAQGDDACWNHVTDPNTRFQECLDYFEPVVEQNITRDFPIVEAHDGRLVITRFNYPTDPAQPLPNDAGPTPVPPSTTNRWVTPPDASNQPFLRALKCCFHSQANVNVRTGGEWVATGSVSGLLHHVTVDPSGKTDRCVLACDSQESLLNARSLGFFPPPGSDFKAPDRDSPLSMRNPMFAYFLTHPLGPGPTLAPGDPAYQKALNGCPAPDDGGIPCAVQRVGRDLSWEFTVLNAFTNQVINLGANGGEVSPRSMLFIPSLGQIAVVDGAQDGLIIIDLSTIAVAGTPFF